MCFWPLKTSLNEVLMQIGVSCSLMAVRLLCLFSRCEYILFFSLFILSMCRMHKLEWLQITVSRVFAISKQNDAKKSHEAKYRKRGTKTEKVQIFWMIVLVCLYSVSVSLYNFFPVPLGMFCNLTSKQRNALKIVFRARARIHTIWHSIEWAFGRDVH